jgi:membrane dipeptidase
MGACGQERKGNRVSGLGGVRESGFGGSADVPVSDDRDAEVARTSTANRAAMGSAKCMRLNWQDLGSARAEDADGEPVEISGFGATASRSAHVRHFILTCEPGCCAGCFPRDLSASVEVFAAAPVPMYGQLSRLTGTWRVRRDDCPGWRYQLHDARLLDPPGWAAVTRRGMLAAGPLMCLAACVTANSPQAIAQRQTDAQRALRAAPSVDIHTHAGGIASVRRMREGHAFGAVSAPMRQGGMAAICLAVVSDGPTHRIGGDGRIHPYRDPGPGELYQYAQLAFGRVHDLVRDQGLTVIRNAAELRAARAGTASAIISAEGADFLEGQIDRVDEAYAKWSLRHLQLTHYRVNELGDIQTEPAVHGGLTNFGADVIRRCNRTGIVVDVAHGTYELVQRAASVTSKPLVLSHTSLSETARPYTRRITSAHARVIASTGGVIGVWPPASEFMSLAAMATGMARMVDVVGIDHVGLGTDMTGLVGPSVLPDYDQLPGLAEALIGVGFSVADTTKLLGGNYIRVFEASMV